MQANIHEAKKTNNTMVVDITYFCDATCKYCQWGNSKTPGRVPIDLDKILIQILARRTLENLKINRIVLSEPRLHPHCSQIIEYYKKLVNNVRYVMEFTVPARNYDPYWRYFQGFQEFLYVI